MGCDDVPISNSKSNTGDGWDIIKSWISECDATHPECRRRALLGGPIPTRLLHVGRSGSKTIRLCEELPPSTKYASLSHCWGDRMPIRLLTTNVDAFKTNIPLSQLSKTFQEAIEVAHNLGVEYLWIDSLCIIQNSGEDWTKEAALMHEVYSNAVFNICATGAKNGREGLFRKRYQRLLHPCHIDIDWTPIHRGRYVCVDTTMERELVDKSPLNKRAWVYQERLLSVRNIHFSETQVFWECQHLSACERFPRGFPPSFDHEVFTSKTFDFRHPARKQALWGLSNESRLNGYTLWDTVVTSYTAGSLTQDSDKLVAIAAVAKHCHQLLGGQVQYLAGMWRKYLACQLLWQSETRGDQSRNLHNSGYQAPTW